MANAVSSALTKAEEQLTFPEEAWPRRDDLVPMVKHYQHTGKRLSKDEQLVQGICEALIARGWSERDVAKAYHVSRHTVRAMMSELEASGKLAPLKQRLSQKLGLLAELSIDASIDLVRRDGVPANVLPIMSGVALDKKERIDAGNGGAGGTTVNIEITVQDLQAHWQKLKAIDVKSSVSSAEPSVKAGPGGPDGRQDNNQAGTAGLLGEGGEGGSRPAGGEPGEGLGGVGLGH